jgi:hypothetical protein
MVDPDGHVADSWQEPFVYTDPEGQYVGSDGY